MIAVECEDNRLVCCKQSVVLCVCQTVRMFCMLFQFHQVNYVDNADLQFRKCVTQDCYSCKSLKCRCVAAACHYEVRLLSLIVACPVPDTDTLCTVFYSLLHCQPLLSRMLGSYDYVYIISASDTVIEAGQQTVRIRRKVKTYYVCLLIGNVIQESGILMCKSVVILLPYVG